MAVIDGGDERWRCVACDGAGGWAMVSLINI